MDMHNVHAEKPMSAALRETEAPCPLENHQWTSVTFGRPHEGEAVSGNKDLWSACVREKADFLAWKNLGGPCTVTSVGNGFARNVMLVNQPLRTAELLEKRESVFRSCDVGQYAWPFWASILWLTLHIDFEDKETCPLSAYTIWTDNLRVHFFESNIIFPFI